MVQLRVLKCLETDLIDVQLKTFIYMAQKTFLKLPLFLFIISSSCFVLFSCNQSQGKIDSLNSKIENLENRKDDLSDKDFQSLENQMNDLQNDLEENRSNYTDDQIREIGKIQGRYSKILLKKGLKDLKQNVKDFGTQMEGFIEGITDTTNDKNQ